MPAPAAKDIQHAISRHGVIGDMRTLALVADDGTITFFCHPEIDSPSVFASILDDEKGGSFTFAAEARSRQANTKQMYLPDTNILITRFLDEGGIGEVCDFMPIDGTGRIVRRAKAITASVDFAFDMTPRPDYGRTKPQLTAIEGGFSIGWEGAESPISVYTSFPVTIADDRVTARIGLEEDEDAYVVLCPGRAGAPKIDDAYVRRTFRETRDYWHKWVNRGNYPSFWRELVVRSALTLKLLTSAQHGSIAAAATFGLPEVPGGERNWDYRYCWVRDAAFTLYSLSRLGYYDEAETFIHFLMERAVEDGAQGLQIMYGMDGRSELGEVALDHLSGYAGSRPVRIGNGAFDQLQLDIYGEFMDAVYISTKARGKPAYSVWIKLARMTDWVCENWRRKDKGIWESRGEPQEYLSSRLMCWVALDRALRMALEQSLPANIEEWRRERDTIQKTLLEEFWNPEIGAFTQFKGSTTLDAVVLLMPLVKFINPRDPMWTSTLKAVKRELVHDCLVYRYKNGAENDDGLDGEEGAFTICSFWYVEALARTGYVAEARLLFEKLHTYANHLGLYSEELSSAGDHLGNFPQALTHLSLISAAIWLDRALNGDSQDPHYFEFNMLEDPDGIF
ncbi:glycoside hydrolase family 15 protein [Fulvimarina sp. 2208YS6-2-32]|uniref:Glycoside hydrolase family 15 protein n=1 Tax=Fulvimarina uroteuthidis TaxID=3098149 RepID=A0ABU5HYM2_9HYPH|nr:glycoside hydrolase family 15 protein [Fulvimarina sp. 2208YS6-2-32]MDY8108223.1 glycoside hydrolase family 15 protein [Fulvimarina sp. 2208YS6-2-32]